jgi:hypothetical protein
MRALSLLRRGRLHDGFCGMHRSQAGVEGSSLTGRKEKTSGCVQQLQIGQAAVEMRQGYMERMEAGWQEGSPLHRL